MVVFCSWLQRSLTVDSSTRALALASFFGGRRTNKFLVGLAPFVTVLAVVLTGCGGKLKTANTGNPKPTAIGATDTPKVGTAQRTPPASGGATAQDVWDIMKRQGCDQAGVRPVPADNIFLGGKATFVGDCLLENPNGSLPYGGANVFGFRSAEALMSWIANHGYGPLVASPTSAAWIVYNGGQKAGADYIVSKMGGGHEKRYSSGL
jgi:hypothetical protein